MCIVSKSKFSTFAQLFMEIINWFIDFVLHMDKHLLGIVNDYHQWVYLMLFVIILLESGCVLTPILPGDSLLFTTGALMALPDMELKLQYCLLLLIVAAIFGFYANYEIGKIIGQKILKKNFKYFNQNHLSKTHEFYEKYGASAIMISRFLPFIRTYVPFVAGVALMDKKQFMIFNILGGIIWIGSVMLLGYFLGNVPVIKNNFSIVVIGIIIVSAIPALSKVVSHYWEKAKSKKIN